MQTIVIAYTHINSDIFWMCCTDACGQIYHKGRVCSLGVLQSWCFLVEYNCVRNFWQESIPYAAAMSGCHSGSSASSLTASADWEVVTKRFGSTLWCVQSLGKKHFLIKGNLNSSLFNFFFLINLYWCRFSCMIKTFLIIFTKRNV